MLKDYFILGRIVASDDKKLWEVWINDKKLIVLKNRDRFWNNLKQGALVKIKKSLLGSNINSIRAENLKIVSLPTTEFCLSDPDWDLRKRLKNRISDLREPRKKIVLKLRSLILNEIRKYLLHNDFIEVTTPLIIGSMLEGKTKKFEIDFHKKKAFLTMSHLLYLNLLTFADYDRIFTVAPVLQAGQANTSVQTNEFLVVDWARRCININISEEINFINNLILKLCKETQNYLVTSDLYNWYKRRRDHKMFKNPPIIKYLDVIKIIKNTGNNIENIENQRHIPQQSIRIISGKIGKVIWIKDFPKNFKPFYCKVVDGKYVLSAELWWDDFKIATTSISEKDIKKQIERINYLGLPTRNFSTYLSTLRRGVTFSFLSTINFDRLIAKLLSINNIKEVIPFPRATRHTVLDP